MRIWTDLPAESRKEVIKRLDLMSRTAMRSTSRAHRELVDSTDFFVPRVRFSMKESDCMIMIYTGIEKFLRIEIDTKEQGVMVYRMENTYNRSEATTRVIPSIGAYTLAYKILKSLFMHDTTLLGALEFEYYEVLLAVQKMTVAYMCRAFDGGRFRTKKLVTNWRIMQDPEMMFYKNVCDLEVLEVLVNDGIRLDTEELVPRKILDVTRIPDPKKKGEPAKPILDGCNLPIQHFIHVPHHESNIWLAQERFHQRDVIFGKAKNTEEGFVTMRFGNFPDEPDMWGFQDLPVERLNERVLMKRIAVQSDITCRWNKSECGLWVHVMKYENEHKYLDYFKNEKCGLRWLCKKCTDPFEYWFYQQLPRRIYYEPEWCFTTLGIKGDVGNKRIKKLAREMSAQYAQDEKKRGKKKAMAESWGFKKSNSPKKPPPTFVCGEDFDDLNGLIKSGKTLHVDLRNFEIKSSEWIHFYNSKKLASMSTSDKKKAMQSLVDNRMYRVEDGKILGSLFPSFDSKKVLESPSAPQELSSEGEEKKFPFIQLLGVPEPFFARLTDEQTAMEALDEIGRRLEMAELAEPSQEENGEESEDEG